MCHPLIRFAALALGIVAAAAASAPAQDPPGPVYPNLLLEVSAGLVNEVAKQDVERTEPISQTKGKMRVFGSSYTKAVAGVEFVPNLNGAVIEFLLRGGTHAQTTAMQGPVTLSLNTRISYAARKRVLIDENGLHALGPAQSSPHLDENTLLGLSTRFRGPLDPLVRRFAMKMYNRKKAETEAEILREARQKIEEQFEKQATEQLAKGNQQFQKDVKARMVEKGIWPQRLRILSSDTHIGLRALNHDPKTNRPPPFAPVPELVGAPDVTVRVEQSFLNNATHNLFAGKTYTGPELDKVFNLVYAPLGEEIQLDDPGDKPFTITFAKEKPMEFKFEKMTVTITIRGDEFTSGENEYDGMNTTAVYAVKRVGMGFVAERGELIIFPPGFVPGTDRLSFRQQVLRKLLEKKFGKVLKPKYEVKGGEMLATQVESENGWLVLGLDRTQKDN